MDVKKTAAQILKEVGGKENIKEMFHCVTRLRFYVKDYKKVDLENIKKRRMSFVFLYIKKVNSAIKKSYSTGHTFVISLY